MAFPLAVYASRGRQRDSLASALGANLGLASRDGPCVRQKNQNESNNGNRIYKAYCLTCRKAIMQATFLLTGYKSCVKLGFIASSQD